MGGVPPLRFLYDGPPGARRRLAIAHGAGAPMDSDFMAAIADLLAQRGIRVARFEFPYMRARRASGGLRPPDRETVLRASWSEAIDRLGAGWAIGGKSMGGRIATLVADELVVPAVACLGYPFHPAGRPERTRVEHLKGLATPTLIVQGTRDALGNADEVPRYALSSRVQVAWIPDGDHSLAPRRSSGRTLAQNLAAAAGAIETFLEDLPG